MGFKDFGTLLGAALLLDWADFKDNNRLMALFSITADTGFEALILVFRSIFIRRLTVSEYKSISRVLGQSHKNSFTPITTIRYKKNDISKQLPDFSLFEINFRHSIFCYFEDVFISMNSQSFCHYTEIFQLFTVTAKYIYVITIYFQVFPLYIQKHVESQMRIIFIFEFLKCLQKASVYNSELLNLTKPNKILFFPSYFTNSSVQLVLLISLSCLLLY